MKQRTNYVDLVLDEYPSILPQVNLSTTIILSTHITFQTADLQAFYHHHKSDSKEGERSTRAKASQNQTNPTNQSRELLVYPEHSMNRADSITY